MNVMRRQITGTFILLFLSAFCAIGAPQKDTVNAAWLRKGCVAIIAFDARGKTNMGDDKAILFQAVMFIRGFIDGFCTAQVAVKEESELFSPPDDWLDVSKAAASLLNFMKKNEGRIPDNTSARMVMALWYCGNHPKATDANKASSEKMLNNLMRN